MATAEASTESVTAKGVQPEPETNSTANDNDGPASSTADSASLSTQIQEAMDGAEEQKTAADQSSPPVAPSEPAVPTEDAVTANEPEPQPLSATPRDPAVDQLHALFPDVDLEIIETVLAASGGSLDEATEQLLILSDPSYKPDPVEVSSPGSSQVVQTADPVWINSRSFSSSRRTRSLRGNSRRRTKRLRRNNGDVVRLPGRSRLRPQRTQRPVEAGKASLDPCRTSPMCRNRGAIRRAIRACLRCLRPSRRARPAGRRLHTPLKFRTAAPRHRRATSWPRLENRCASRSFTCFLSRSQLGLTLLVAPLDLHNDCAVPSLRNKARRRSRVCSARSRRELQRWTTRLFALRAFSISVIAPIAPETFSRICQLTRYGSPAALRQRSTRHRHRCLVKTPTLRSLLPP